MIKKLFMSVLLIVLLSSSLSYAATSEDVNALVMNSINSNFERVFTRLDRLENSVSTLAQSIATLSGRIEGLSGRIDGMDYKVDVLQTVVYWGLGILSTILTLVGIIPMLLKFIRDMTKPSFTLEDVKRLIEENNARLNVSQM